jgi:3-carboxy-cis,cis-muconate cycloisomerase
LTADLGRLPAHDLVSEASDRALAEGTDLRTQLARWPEVTGALDDAALARLLDPTDATATARVQVDRALAHHEQAAADPAAAMSARAPARNPGQPDAKGPT